MGYPLLETERGIPRGMNALNAGLDKDGGCRSSLSDAVCMGVSMAMSVTAEQAVICARFRVEPLGVDPEQKVGIARNVLSGLMPVNGLRHKPEGDTSGWYIWSGEELSDAQDFFVPLHVEHLIRWCPSAIPYLALPPGWRFLIAPGHEDVWLDQSLLQV